MYELSRVRLYSIGPAGARYADTVLDLRGVGAPVPHPAPAQAEFFEEEPVGPPRRPAPAGVLFLENGGGKSVLLKLIFSVMLPGHRNTLGGASSGVLRKFLLADDCGHVALEWQHTLTGELVVVGKASEWRGRQVSNDPRKFAEAWYSFRPGPGLSLDSLPVAESTSVRAPVEGASRRAGPAPHDEGLPGRHHRGGQVLSASRHPLGGDPRPLERTPRRSGSGPRTLPLPAGDERRRGGGCRPLRGQEGLRLHRSPAACRHRHPGHGRARGPRRGLRQQAGASCRARRPSATSRPVPSNCSAGSSKPQTPAPVLATSTRAPSAGPVPSYAGSRPARATNGRGPPTSPSRSPPPPTP